MKVGDLKAILARFNDDLNVEVAAVPDHVGWTNDILWCVHNDDQKVVLALRQETTTDEEQSLVFRDEDGNVVRPI